jgi:hypothetical protein
LKLAHAGRIDQRRARRELDQFAMRRRVCVLSFLIIEQRRMHAIKLALGATTNRVAMSVVTFAAGTALFGLALGYIALLPIAKISSPCCFEPTSWNP